MFDLIFAPIQHVVTLNDRTYYGKSGGKELHHSTTHDRQHLFQIRLWSCMLPDCQEGTKAIVSSVKEVLLGQSWAMQIECRGSTCLESPWRNLNFLSVCCMTGINFFKVAERNNQEIFQAALLHLTGDFEQLRSFILSNSTDLNGVLGRRCAICLRRHTRPWTEVDIDRCNRNSALHTTPYGGR
jgi:hypothetical protein